MCKLLVSYNTLVCSELGYLVRQLILISWKSGCRQTHLSRGTQKESTTISYLNLTELTLTSVDFGLDVGFRVVISFYHMKTSLNHTLFLVFFVLFCPRILWANVLCFLFFLLFYFLVHQPFWPLSSLLHLNGQTEKSTSFSPILILFWLISQYTSLWHSHVSQKQLFVSQLYPWLTQYWKPQHYSLQRALLTSCLF